MTKHCRSMFYLTYGTEADASKLFCVLAEGKKSLETDRQRRATPGRAKGQQRMGDGTDTGKEHKTRHDKTLVSPV